MHKWLWMAANAILLLAFALIASGCSMQMKWFGAGGVECEWDEINYKSHYDAAWKESYSGNDDLRRQAERKMREAEEAQREFGVCSDSDLALHSCK